VSSLSQSAAALSLSRAPCFASSAGRPQWRRPTARLLQTDFSYFLQLAQVNDSAEATHGLPAGAKWACGRPGWPRAAGETVTSGSPSELHISDVRRWRLP